MKILIVCGGGFSSSSLVQNLNREIARQGREDELSADFLFHMGFDDVDIKRYDVIMFSRIYVFG